MKSIHKIIFKKIRIQNFMSIGPMLEFDFEKHTGINFVYGIDNDIVGMNNGAGKTTIFIDAILWALYGKTSKDLKKERIPNRQISDKDMMLVELSFSINNCVYIIETGMKNKGKGSFLNLYKDNDKDNPITKSSMPKTREHIEKHILKCPYDMFKNSITLCPNESSKFFNLGKQSKRDFIESVFDLRIFGEMLKLSRKDSNKLNKEILLLESTIKKLDSDIKDFTKKDNNFDNDKKIIIEKLEKKIDKKHNDIKRLNNEINKVSEDNSKLKDKVIIGDGIKEKLKKIEEAKYKIDSTLNVSNVEIKNNNKLINKHIDVLNLICEDCKLDVEKT